WEQALLVPILVKEGPAAALGYSLRNSQRLAATAASSVLRIADPLGVWTGLLGNPFAPTTALDRDARAGSSSRLESLVPTNQALRSQLEANQTGGFERGVNLADTQASVLDTISTGVGGGLLARGIGRAISELRSNEWIGQAWASAVRSFAREANRLT